MRNRFSRGSFPSGSAAGLVLFVVGLVVLGTLGTGDLVAQCDQHPSYPLGEWTGVCTSPTVCSEWHVYETPTSGTWVSVVGPGTFTQDVPLVAGGSFVATFVVPSIAYESVAIGTVSLDGCSMSGTWSDSNGSSGTFERSWRPFRRADANDDQNLNIADPITMLAYLFPATVPGPALLCADAYDANDDGALDIADPIYTLTFLFSQGPPIPAPNCAGDPTGDSLNCEEFTTCS